MSYFALSSESVGTPQSCSVSLSRLSEFKHELHDLNLASSVNSLQSTSAKSLLLMAPSPLESELSRLPPHGHIKCKGHFVTSMHQLVEVGRATLIELFYEICTHADSGNVSPICWSVKHRYWFHGLPLPARLRIN